jgi:hypothetical protein
MQPHAEAQYGKSQGSVRWLLHFYQQRYTVDYSQRHLYVFIHMHFNTSAKCQIIPDVDQFSPIHKTMPERGRKVTVLIS